MNDLRGSMWRKCDFHIHTPFSVLNQKFGDDFDLYVKTIFKKAIEKNIKVIGITDYFTIDGYKKIKTDYLENDDKLKELFINDEIEKIKEILVLPNIEFRLNKIVQVVKKDQSGAVVKKENGRINFHVLISDEVSIRQIEENFLHDIEFVHEAEPAEPDRLKKLKTENLKELGKRLKEEQSELSGTHLQIGMSQAVVDDKVIIDLLTGNNDFKGKYLVVVPSDEDLSDIKWKSQDGLTRKILLQKAHAFFASNENTIKFGLGEKHPDVDDFIKEFKTLKPCIWGSDAHEYDDLFEPKKQRYCWLKADPTFEGIKQILYEPKDRVFIGNYPKLYERIKNNRDNYIDTLTINQIEGYNNHKGVWFNDIKIKLGFELTAIIGNKGKGKSAIADIIGLLGNSHVDRSNFSFLNEDKFCQKGYAESFISTLKWFDKTENTKKLSEPFELASVERVKYIPQAYLEKLCNNEGDGFTEEINKVVFSRLDDSDKLGKTSFSELKKFKTEIINQEIDELKIKLNAINKTFITLEHKDSSEYKKGVENKLKVKKQELNNHEEIKKSFKEIPNPEKDIKSSVEQREKAKKVTQLHTKILKLDETILINSKKIAVCKIEFADLENILSEVKTTSEKFRIWKNTKSDIYKKYQLDIDEIIDLKINTDGIKILIEKKRTEISQINKYLSEQSIKTDEEIEQSLVFSLNTLKKEKEIIEKELEKPFKDYQLYQQNLKEWEAKKKIIIGDDITDGSIVFLEKELNYLKEGLSVDIKNILDERVEIITKIYEQKKQIQEIYNKVKIAISGILEEYSEEQNITIETSFKMESILYSKFFDYINRYGVFYQNADDELKKIVSNYNLDDIDQIKEFLMFLFNSDIRYKDGRVLDFYNYLCSLDYLNPEYDLRLNGKSLVKLSPGEKGGLLLVFYLVLDKDNKPLIIDQPEDNLDNQSVAEILVPYIKNAKKKRQIIMVTHNPNLAIVADAEQIIYMDIDKENNYKVSYESGGIENLNINNHIVDILEGKMKAFDNRRVKYRSNL